MHGKNRTPFSKIPSKDLRKMGKGKFSLAEGNKFHEKQKTMNK